MKKKLLYFTLILVIFLSNSPIIFAQSSVISLDRIHIIGSPYSFDTKERKAYEAERINTLNIIAMYLQEYDKKSSFPVYLRSGDSSCIQYNNLVSNYFNNGFDRENYSKPPYSVGIVIITNLHNPHEYLKLLDYAIKKEKKLRKYFEAINKIDVDDLTEEDIEKLTKSENQFSDILKKPNKRVEKFIKKYNIKNQ